MKWSKEAEEAGNWSCTILHTYRAFLSSFHIPNMASHFGGLVKLQKISNVSLLHVSVHCPALQPII